MSLAFTPSALTLTVACALALAAADYFRKATQRTVPAMVLLFYFTAGQLPLLGLWVWIAASGPWPVLDASYWCPALADLAASLVGNAVFIIAIRRSPLSLVIPLLSLSPVFTLILGAALLNEWPTPRQVAGVILATAGVFYLYQPAGAPLSPIAMWRNFRGESGALLMVGVAVAWALTAPLDKLAMARAGVARHALILVSLLAALAGAGVALMRPRRLTTLSAAFKVPLPAVAPIAAAAVTAGASYAFQLAAYHLAFVALVESVKRVIEILAALIVGLLFFREPITVTKTVGVSLIAVGIPLMMLP